ncbi:MAG TPA: hypothetical protein VKB85_09215 [Propionibacteriaceae bacterium]|nr:hypothetical protein [Propionibacteriaceae bacterium]
MRTDRAPRINSSERDLEGAWPSWTERNHAAVRVDVAYGPPAEQESRDVWLLRFADDGRVEDFEEWPYCPGKHYSAEETGSPSTTQGAG